MNYDPSDSDEDDTIDPLIKKFASEVHQNKVSQVEKCHTDIWNKKIQQEQEKRCWRCPFENLRTKARCTEVRTDHRAKDSIYCKKHKP